MQVQQRTKFRLHANSGYKIFQLPPWAPKPATVDLIHTAGASRPPRWMRRIGGIVMIRATTRPFTTVNGRTDGAFLRFFPVNGEASSTPSQLGSSMLPPVSILG